MTRRLSALCAALLLAGCSTLPADGPSSRALDAASATYAMVELDYATTQALRLVEPGEDAGLTGADFAGPLDLIGVDDVLSVSIYEPSGALFGARGPDGRVSGGSETLSATVDREGRIGVPFGGRVAVAGLTSSQAADAVRRALQGRVGSPQVTVSLAERPSNGVTVLGEVRTPGRATLRTGASRVLDVIASAGGASRPAEEVEVRLRRDGREWSAPLTAVMSRFDANVRLAPGDQLALIHRPRRFSAFGALGQVTQQDMGPGELTLAAALARTGGLAPDRADARQVLVFRFERPEIARALGLSQPVSPRGVPVIYRLDLSRPDGLFVAQEFVVRPDDLIYVPRSGSAELRGFFELVQSVTRVVYDVSVTGAANFD
ncbi:MAG TPA: polysaccharide biosynthesis/export family protein [Brevundimonas sp.]|jgi:polysaccharide export outer membrane protein|uniref:polysaccharide biosynthesis/export family protein n=1 Tax=Brevundimonas sp. TaxID=1871086 RepID=UPI002DF12F32|nr:polysaccharide biosynthesis/export family protein [Brevundimonas sp.]